MSIIDDFMASDFVDDPDNADLSINEGTEITEDAAEILSAFEGDLWGSDHTGRGRIGALQGLTELSDAALESLSKKEGRISGQDPKEWADSLRK